jgi:hypothetical protein
MQEPLTEAAGMFFANLVFQTGVIKPEDAGYSIMQHCRKGDIRLKQLFMAPGTVSVIAWRSGSLLTTRAVGDKTVGTIRKGIVAPEDMFDMQLGGELSERLKARLFLLLIATVTVLLATDNYLWRVTFFVTIGLAVGVGKALIWNAGLFRMEIWLAVFFMVGTTLSGLWQFHGRHGTPLFRIFE